MAVSVSFLKLLKLVILTIIFVVGVYRNYDNFFTLTHVEEFDLSSASPNEEIMNFVKENENEILEEAKKRLKNEMW